MSELLIELFCEEIPARLQVQAAADLKKRVQESLFDAGFMPEYAQSFATPRRLTLVVSGVPLVQPDKREEKKGPRVGAPEKALAGFLKSAGLDSLDQCETREDKKGAYYVAVVEQTGRATPEIIAEIIPDVIQKFPWPKSMRWGRGDMRWVRPLHRILCVFDGEVVSLKVGELEACDKTQGHRFMAPDEIQVRHFEEYAEKLKRAKVILAAQERAEHILGEARGLCAAQGMELVEDSLLLSEVVGLTEWPVVMIGTFDDRFLSLPDETLIAAMKGHQKYFSVRDPKTGRLANMFIFVANIEAADGGAAMRKGYERVLTARLSDAWFLYTRDRKTPLAVQTQKLDNVTFFAGLGSVGDKVRRIQKWAHDIAPFAGADPALAVEAASLAKADLVSEMVGEFASLQGVMGRYYALEQGVSPQVADAIRDHYKPVAQGGDLPGAPVSTTVALADKLDTLTQFWSIGETPTGSKDPFALRRAALGVIQILLNGKLRYALPEGDLLSFFHNRLRIFLKESGHNPAHVDAVSKDTHGVLHRDVFLVVKKMTALEAFLKTEDGKNLIAAYKRAANILKTDSKQPETEKANTINPDLFSQPEEVTLYEKVCLCLTQTKKAVAQEDFQVAMQAICDLRLPLDTFFECVIVNAEDGGVRANRLALLQEVKSACDLVADLSNV